MLLLPPKSRRAHIFHVSLSTCFLCSILNKTLVFEIYKSMYSVFIYILRITLGKNKTRAFYLDTMFILTLKILIKALHYGLLCEWKLFLVLLGKSKCMRCLTHICPLDLWPVWREHSSCLWGLPWCPPTPHLGCHSTRWPVADLICDRGSHWNQQSTRVHLKQQLAEPNTEKGIRSENKKTHTHPVPDVEETLLIG